MAQQEYKREPIAITGTGCRYPGGADSPSKLWKLLRDPPDLLKAIPPSKFNPKGFYHPDGKHLGVSKDLLKRLLHCWSTQYESSQAHSNSKLLDVKCDRFLSVG
jgi:hypothetical protein